MMRAHSPGRPPGRPHRTRPARGGHRRRPARPGARSPSRSGPETPRTPWPTGAAVVLDPYEDTWAVPHLDADHRRRAARRCCRRPPTRCCAPGSGTRRAARFHNAAARPRADVLDVVEAAAARSRTATTRPLRAAMPWLLGQVAAAGRRPGGRARPASTGGAASPATAAGRVRPSSSRRSRPRSARHRRRPAAAAWLDGRDLPAGLELDLDLRWRRPGPARRRSARPTGTSCDAALEAEPTARSRVEHVAGGRLAPRRRGQGVGLGALHRRGRRPQLRARGGRAPACGARRPGGAHRAVRRPLLRRPARHRRGARRAGCSPRRPTWFFPSTSVTEETLARARALIADDELDVSLRRRLVDQRRRPGTAGSRSASASAGDDPRPRPPPRTHRPDPGARGTATARTATARTGSPPRSRWRSGCLARARPPRRVWVTMRTPATTSSWPPGALVHEGLAAPGDVQRGRLLHRRDLDPRAGVQRRHRDPGRAPAARPRPPARRARRGRRPAGCAARTASPPCSTCPRASPWAGRAARRPTVVRRLPALLREAPAGVRPHRRCARRRACSPPTATLLGGPRGRRPAQRRRQGLRRPGPGRRPPRRGLPGGQRPGRLRARAEGRRGRGRLPGRRRGAHPAWRCTWPREAGSALYGFTSPDRCVQLRADGRRGGAAAWASPALSAAPF